MNICFATSECVPYAKTGGLADVAGSLPGALAEQGCEVKVFMPLYESINTIDHNLTFCHDLGYIPVQMGDRSLGFYTWYGHLPETEVEIYFIDCPTYYHRPGLYTQDPDEGERFIFLQHAIFLIMQRYNWAPDVIHSNDWHTALMPALLKEIYSWDGLFAETGSLFSIHNIGYQGLFAPDLVGRSGLPWHLFEQGMLEWNGAFGFMKTALLYAEIISTVSETYAHEIQTPEYGSGLEHLLKSRSEDIYGVINGIDTTDWNPATDPFISHNYSASRLSGKVKNKKALLEAVGLPYSSDVPTLGLISRLTPQKGFELLQPILSYLMHDSVQFVMLGSGEDRYENFFRWASASYPDKVYAYVGYNNALSHQITAGCDMFVMPSRYEPCGMNQMYSLNYGTVPIVRHTGGLADTVQDYHAHGGNGNGFSFHDFKPEALYLSIRRALDLFKDQAEWKAVMKRGMRTDFSWTVSAKRYLTLYQKAKEMRLSA